MSSKVVEFPLNPTLASIIAESYLLCTSLRRTSDQRIYNQSMLTNTRITAIAPMLMNMAISRISSPPIFCQ